MLFTCSTCKICQIVLYACFQEAGAFSTGCECPAWEVCTSRRQHVSILSFCCVHTSVFVLPQYRKQFWLIHSHHQFIIILSFSSFPHACWDATLDGPWPSSACCQTWAAKRISLSRVGHGEVSAVDVPFGVSHIRNKQQVSSLLEARTPPSDSWDTDFSDDDHVDDTSEVSDMNRMPTLKCTIRKLRSNAHCNKKQENVV